MTLPPPLECLDDWQVEAADLLAYPGWRARRLKTVCEVEEAAWSLCSAIDARLGEGAAKQLLAWYDATARSDVLAMLLGLGGGLGGLGGGLGGFGGGGFPGFGGGLGGGLGGGKIGFNGGFGQ
jgi:hypothetical protein